MVETTIFHRPLTWQQRRLVRAVDAFHAEHGYAPTVREVQLALGNASPSTVYVRLSLMRERGMVTWVDGQVRTLVVTERGKRAIENRR